MKNKILIFMYVATACFMLLTSGLNENVWASNLNGYKLFSAHCMNCHHSDIEKKKISNMGFNKFIKKYKSDLSHYEKLSKDEMRAIYTYLKKTVSPHR